MTFPNHAPSARAYQPGNWPIKTFRAIDGAEVRILYGNSETEAKLSLTYENIPDTAADDFVQHYRSVRGTFQQFPLTAGVYSGWQGDGNALEAAVNTKWRYEGPPKLQAVRPGVSTVQVDLMAVI